MHLTEVDTGDPGLLEQESDHANLSCDTDTDEINPTTSQTAESEKSQAQRDAFNQYIRETSGRDQPQSSSNSDAEKVAQESARIIDKARDYQQELFERAKLDNIIAVLDTGSGKTLIACLLIRHMLDQELLDRTAGEPPRFIFFLVNSVHLVRQQARVLSNNLANPPAALHGSGKDDLWKKVNWDEILKNNTAVVCTAEVLNQCLMHNYLRIDQISLLVLDECHHAKKAHPYAKIMWDYYMRASSATRRPKIFGMTASPVHSKTDINKAATTLEAILHAKIVTTSSMSLFEHAPRAQNEEWTYDPLPVPFETDLCRKIRHLCNIEELQKYFVFSLAASQTLGSWAADQIWYYILSEREAVKLVKIFEQSKAYTALATTLERERALKGIEHAAMLVQKHQFAEPTVNSQHLSSKVLLLYEELSKRYKKAPGLRCMIFVDQRLTAEVLCDCFKLLRIPNLRPGVLLGVNQAAQSLDSKAASPKHQEAIMDHFQAGLINCVFSTSVGEEGIDIPQCSLVIRFDLFKTPIQYMQSRGRARLKGSVFAMMIEAGSFEQRAIVDYALDSEEYIKDFCAKLPEDRLLGNTNVLARMIAKASNNQIFETSTGASCSYSNSMLVLSRYASSLHHQGSLDSDVSYELDVKDNMFRYRAILPMGSEVKGASGDYKTNKQLAKRSAAWNCCYILRSKALLDENLDSIYIRQRPENANAHLAVSAKKHEYAMKIKPDFWKINDKMTPTCLYATVIDFVPTEKLARHLHTMVLLTRSPLPPLPTFPVFLEKNIQVDVTFKQISHQFGVDNRTLDVLTGFTINGIFPDVFNKVYQHDTNAMSYWLAPATNKSPMLSAEKLGEVVDLKAASEVQAGRIAWERGMSAESWHDRYLVDPRDGRYHYMTRSTVQGATIHSPVPTSAMAIPKKGKDNIIDFTDSFWKQSKNRARDNWDVKQPIFKADMFSFRRNVLAKASDKELATSIVECHIAPEPLLMSRMSTSVAAACMTWPAMLYRLESYMIALEGFAKINVQVPADLALEAFTKDSNTDDQENQVHTGSLRGMGKNYERLEFIGDSLLKMTTTMTVFCLHSRADELGMHVARMLILCNKNLYNVAVDDSKQMFQFARTKGFNRATWYPEGLVLLKGARAKGTEPVKHPEMTHDLGEKTIADISEAMIGAAIVAMKDQPKKFDLAIQVITKLVDSKDHPITAWAQIPPLYKIPEWQVDEHDPIANDLAVKVRQITNYTFQYPRLLRSAFTHTSDMNSPVPDYQRLEFLGDAVLDMVCINWMFNKHEDRNPQWLTEHKMAMVSNKFLAALAVDLGFDKLLAATTVSLFGQINDYAKKVRDVLAYGKENIPHDFWTEIENAPKALSDLVESYIGAVMVDSGFDYHLAEDFFANHILWYFEDLELYSNFANRHPTSYLYKKLTDEYKCMDYDILCSDPKPGEVEISITAGVMIHGAVVSSDTGTSSKYARVRASKKCLKKLEGLSIEEFRREYHCDCRKALVI